MSLLRSHTARWLGIQSTFWDHLAFLAKPIPIDTPRPRGKAGGEVNEVYIEVGSTVFRAGQQRQAYAAVFLERYGFAGDYRTGPSCGLKWRRPSASQEST